MKGFLSFGCEEGRFERLVTSLLISSRRALRAGMAAILLVAAAPALAAFDHGYAGWDALLKRHVKWHSGGAASSVDYRALAGERDALRRVLSAFSALEQAQFARFSRDERLAFLINAYNAFTLELVLTRYPEIKSIKDVGSWFQSPWKKRFFTLLGKETSLDDIEHGMIRAPGAYDEPRIHFAVVCASIGCPALRPEAIVAERLDAQLEDGARRFLSDRSRNRFDAASGRLLVSKIFDWYRADFERAGGRQGSLGGFLARYADRLADPGPGLARVRSGAVEIDFLDYDWRLNDRS